jgi:hypothetical protein
VTGPPLDPPDAVSIAGRVEAASLEGSISLEASYGTVHAIRELPGVGL